MSPDPHLTRGAPADSLDVLTRPLGGARAPDADGGPAARGRPPRAGYRLLALAIGIAALAGAGLFAFRHAPANVADTAPAAATHHAPSRPTDTAAGVITAAGLLKARQIATVSAEVTGTLERVLVERGQQVRQGDPIARLDTSLLETAQFDALTAVASARSDLTRAQAQLPLAETRLARLNRLLPAGAVPRQQVEDAQAEYVLRAAEVRALGLKVDAARNALERSRIDLRKATIRAPFDGVVVSLDAAPGEIVSPISAAGSFARTGIATIVATGPFHADVWVPESLLGKLHQGQRVTLTPDSLPDLHVSGQVRFVSPVVDERRAAVLVEIDPDTHPDAFKHDMSVHVDFFQQEPQLASPSSHP
ncbi:efflux RND transporter periplasmic adaptor subunit [Burkholderia sp. 22PA0106]|uniref:efflux RND transporter periplasmic adaptor subunit n=1 Tax=Burkholderia sp. 22PA0106 TaxID=3237371 RepID=UPI0039C3807E